MISRKHSALSWQKHLRGWLWPRSGWKRLLQHAWKRIRRLKDTPHAIATGFTVGVIVSFTPLLGLHVLLAFLLAWFLRGNIIATFMGTLVGNPVTFPLIWALIYQAGLRISGSEPAAPFDPEAVLTVDALLDTPSWGVMDIFLTMLIGSIPVCMMLAIALYPATRWSVNVYQTKRRQKRARRQQAAARDKMPVQMEKS